MPDNKSLSDILANNTDYETKLFWMAVIFMLAKKDTQN